MLSRSGLHIRLSSRFGSHIHLRYPRAVFLLLYPRRCMCRRPHLSLLHAYEGTLLETKETKGVYYTAAVLFSLMVGARMADVVLFATKITPLRQCNPEDCEVFFYASLILRLLFVLWTVFQI